MTGRLAHRRLGVDRYPCKASEERRITVRVRPEQVVFSAAADPYRPNLWTGRLPVPDTRVDAMTRT
jgi:hypothetical protein